MRLVCSFMLFALLLVPGTGAIAQGVDLSTVLLTADDLTNRAPGISCAPTGLLGGEGQVLSGVFVVCQRLQATSGWTIVSNAVVRVTGPTNTVTIDALLSAAGAGRTSTRPYTIDGPSIGDRARWVYSTSRVGSSSATEEIFVAFRNGELFAAVGVDGYTGSVTTDSVAELARLVLARMQGSASATPPATPAAEAPSAEPPQPENAGSGNVVSLSGRGQMALGPLYLPDPRSAITFTHSGTRNFIVHAYVGDRNELLVNTIGGYSGQRPLVATEPVLFDIQADGRGQCVSNRLPLAGPSTSLDEATS